MGNHQVFKNRIMHVDWNKVEDESISQSAKIALWKKSLYFA